VRARTLTEGTYIAPGIHCYAGRLFGVKNGKLLALAAARFDAFITVDKNLPYQQNTSTLPISVFVLDALSNELPYLLPLVPELEAALPSHKQGSCVLLRTEA